MKRKEEEEEPKVIEQFTEQFTEFVRNCVNKEKEKKQESLFGEDGEFKDSATVQRLVAEKQWKAVRRELDSNSLSGSIVIYCKPEMYAINQQRLREGHFIILDEKGCSYDAGVKRYVIEYRDPSLEEEKKKKKNIGSVTMKIDNVQFLLAGESRPEPIVGEEKSPHHTMRTVSEMLRVVKKESLSNFLVDLASVFEQYYHLCEQGLIVKETAFEEFVWVDDGRHRIDTNLTLDPDSCTEAAKEALVQTLDKLYSRVSQEQ